MAGRVDALYFYLLGRSPPSSSVLIFVTVVLFAVKYRRSQHPVAVAIEGSVPLEIAWTVIPLCSAMVMFPPGEPATIFTRQPASARTP